MTDPISWYRRADRLANRDRPGDAEEAEALLRAAINAGHGRSLVRLAQLLLNQAETQPDSVAEDLLLTAVERGVPQAANALGLLHLDAGDTARAIEYLRRGVADGDGNDLAHQVLSTNLRPNSDLWREIDAAFQAVRKPDAPMRFYCFRGVSWRLDLPDV